MSQLVPVAEPKTADEVMANFRAVRARIGWAEMEAKKREKNERIKRVAARVAQKRKAVLDEQFRQMVAMIQHYRARATKAGRGVLIYDTPIGPSYGNAVRLTVRQAVGFCCKLYGIHVHEIEGVSRVQHLTLARHCAAWLACVSNPTVSAKQIGRELGGRDPATIRSGISRIKALLQSLGIDTQNPVEAIRELAWRTQ